MRDILNFSNVDLLSNGIYRLRDISISVKSGEKIALIGANGAGKSSLLAAASGSLAITSGYIYYKGIRVNTLKDSAKRTIGMIWQDLRLIDELTVLQNINAGVLAKKNMIWALRNLFTQVEFNECLECIKPVSLDSNLLTKNLNTLSGGEKQRVAIARCFRQNADILLGDEPLSNLDPKLTTQILNYLIKNKPLKSISIPSTCIISLHRPDLISNFNRVIALKAGKIVIDKPTDEVNKTDLDNIYAIR